MNHKIKNSFAFLALGLLSVACALFLSESAGIVHNALSYNNLAGFNSNNQLAAAGVLDVPSSNPFFTQADYAYEYCQRTGPANCVIGAFSYFDKNNEQASYDLDFTAVNNKGTVTYTVVDPHPQQTIGLPWTVTGHFLSTADITGFTEYLNNNKLPDQVSQKIISHFSSLGITATAPLDSRFTAGNTAPRQGFWSTSCLPLTDMDQIASSMRSAGFTAAGADASLPSCSGLHSNLCSATPFTPSSDNGLSKPDYESVACQSGGNPYAAANIENTLYRIGSEPVPAVITLSAQSESACAWSDDGDTSITLSVTAQNDPGVPSAGSLSVSFYLDTIDSDHLLDPNQISGTSFAALTDKISLAAFNAAHPEALGYDPTTASGSHKIYAVVTETASGWSVKRTSSPVSVAIGQNSCDLLSLSASTKTYIAGSALSVTVSGDPSVGKNATDIFMYGYQQGQDPSTSQFLTKASFTQLPQKLTITQGELAALPSLKDPFTLFAKLIYPAGTQNAASVKSNGITFAVSNPTLVLTTIPPQGCLAHNTPNKTTLTLTSPDLGTLSYKGTFSINGTVVIDGSQLNGTATNSNGTYSISVPVVETSGTGGGATFNGEMVSGSSTWSATVTFTDSKGNVVGTYTTPSITRMLTSLPTPAKECNSGGAPAGKANFIPQKNAPPIDAVANANAVCGALFDADGAAIVQACLVDLGAAPANTPDSGDTGDNGDQGGDDNGGGDQGGDTGETAPTPPPAPTPTTVGYMSITNAQNTSPGSCPKSIPILFDQDLANTSQYFSSTNSSKTTCHFDTVQVLSGLPADYLISDQGNFSYEFPGNYSVPDGVTDPGENYVVVGR